MGSGELSGKPDETPDELASHQGESSNTPSCLMLRKLG